MFFFHTLSEKKEKENKKKKGRKKKFKRWLSWKHVYIYIWMRVYSRENWKNILYLQKEI